MEKTCKYCHKAFEARRSDAQYCSNNCKVKNHYHKRKNPDVMQEVQQILEGPKPEQSSFDCLMKARQDIKMELARLYQLLEQAEKDRLQLREKLEKALSEKSFSKALYLKIKAQMPKTEEQLFYIVRDANPELIKETSFEEHEVYQFGETRYWLRMEMEEMTEQATTAKAEIDRFDTLAKKYEKELHSESPFMLHIVELIKLNTERLQELDRCLVHAGDGSNASASSVLQSQQYQTN